MSAERPAATDQWLCDVTHPGEPCPADRPAANAQDVLSEMERELAHELRWRRRLCRVVTLGHHLWGKRWRVDVGPAGFVESDATLLGWSKQCRVCYEVVDA